LRRPDRVQTPEASRSCVASMEDPFISTGFSIVTEDAASQEDWRVGFSSVIEGAASEVDWTAGFASVIEGAANQEDWSAVVVAELVQETELLPVWETEVHPDDGGWDTSLAKREC
jgi:hypothetical protein